MSFRPVFSKMFPLLNLTLKSLSNMPVTGAGFLGSSSRRHGYLSSPRPVLGARHDGGSFVCLFSQSAPEFLWEYWPNSQTCVGWGCRWRHWALVQLEPLPQCDPDQTTETILCLGFSSYEMGIIAHLPSLPFSGKLIGGFPCTMRV